MDGLFRRGGVWYARLVVPAKLRSVVGKTEFIASTKVREPLLARIVASELLAAWRRRLHDFSRLADGCMDVQQLVVGSPVLTTGGYLPLLDAAEAAGLDERHLLEAAKDGRVRLFVRVNGADGYLFPRSEIEVFHTVEDPDAEELIGSTEYIIPGVESLVKWATKQPYSGLLRIRSNEQGAVADHLLGGEPSEMFCFDVPDRPSQCFRPVKTIPVTSERVEVKTDEVERVRQNLVRVVTQQQIDAARAAARTALAVEKKAARESLQRFSSFIDGYVKVRGLKISEEQARRIRGALELYAELDGDPRLCDVTAARLARYRDDKLPLVPANENKIRLIHGTKSVSESIERVKDTEWSRITAGEQVKRLNSLAGMFNWLTKQDWWEGNNPAALLLPESQAAATKFKEDQRTAANKKRELFTRNDLHVMFSTGLWFQTGRGEVSARGTYWRYQPHYYWLPLLGLFTGARINELAQIHLNDIRRTEGGVWYVELACLDDESGKKKRKNSSSTRVVPVHPLLLKLGFIEYRDALVATGYARLFPELKHDDVKGYGKAATKWFSGYLSDLGWARDNRKVFHSFRGTLSTEYATKLHVSKTIITQLTGHDRDNDVLYAVYVKDVAVDELSRYVEKLDFALPPIAPFDTHAGLKAITDALGRKNRGRGADEDH